MDTIKHVRAALDYATAKVDDGQTSYDVIVRALINRLSLAVVEHQRIHEPKAAPSVMDYIAELCADFYDVPYSLMRSKSRVRGLAQARFVAWYLQQRYTDSTLKAIGEFWTFRDHSTIYHGIEQVSKKVISSPACELQVLHLQELIEAFMKERVAA